MIPTRVQRHEQARRHSGAYFDLACRGLTQSDVLADELIESWEAHAAGEGMRMLERALAHGIGAVSSPPRALLRLFESIDEVPGWVDWDRIALGARAYQRTGVAGGLVLSAVSLMNGYHSSAAVKPLLFTGRLDKMARRRLAETGKFIADTIQVDGLRRARPGFHATIKVRMVHAAVRRILLQSGRWNTQAWGIPINQTDMVGTNLSFSIALIHGVSVIGLRLTRAESDAIIHLWRYSGFLSGVDIGLLPTCTEDAMYRGELVDMIQPGPDEGSLLLAEALRRVQRERQADGRRNWAVPLLRRYHDGLTRVVIGDEKADALKTPHAGWAPVVRALRPFVNAAELLRERLPLATRLASALGNQAWTAGIAHELQGKKPDFRPPGHLRQCDRAPTHAT